MSIDRKSKDEKGKGTKQRKRGFCHFWNHGWCKFRDSECKFLHEESPEYKTGKECKMKVRFCHFWNN